MKTSAVKNQKADFLKSPLFGMWKDYPGTVEDYMREVRKPRFDEFGERSKTAPLQKASRKREPYMR
jgi:hypothetical protein